jgi:hypothetical protein
MPALCPCDHDLRAFSTGDLPEETFEAIAQHVESCPICQTSLDSIGVEPNELLSQLSYLDSVASVRVNRHDRRKTSQGRAAIRTQPMHRLASRRTFMVASPLALSN